MNLKSKSKIKELKGSLLEFTKTYYLARTNRKFNVYDPVGRESHIVSICRELEDVFYGKTNKLIINIPPRYSKTELAIHFVAWALAHFPDSNFLYISYAHSLAKKQTQTIRSILQLNCYKYLFDVDIKDDSSAKDNFETTAGGSVYAAGSGGTITGRGAGIKFSNRFGGCIIIDDIHKPDEATSDTIRESIKEWYYNTLQSRCNDPKTPIIFIGQRLHEDDLASTFIGKDEWKKLILPALDQSGNALCPEMHDVFALKKMQEESPYNFAAQYQQDPQPSGGGIFQREWFPLHEYEPNILTTFLTVDTAETDKTWNDATVFSFWGIYKIKHDDVEREIYAIHLIDCVEIRVEPKDLKSAFFEFYNKCMLHFIKPRIVGIEKKSTGVTLSSILKTYQGIEVIDIDRTKASGNKITRYLEMQPYISSGLVSLPMHGKHTEMVLEHMRKITANLSHRFDDICDTAFDAVKLALIDQTIIYKNLSKRDYSEVARNLMSNANRIDKLRHKAYY